MNENESLEPKKNKTGGGARVQKKRNPGIYFILVFALTWTFWIPAAIINIDLFMFPTILLYILGGMFPSLVGIILTYRMKDKEEVHDFWKRVIDVKRIHARGYAIIFLVNVVPILVPIIVGLSFGMQGNNFFGSGDFFASFGFVFALILNLLAVLFEELGWRGYALDGLQEHRKPLASSIILAVFWFSWHVPLFFTKGSYQNEIGFGTPGFWLFGVNILTQTILMTWIFNNNKRSIFSALLFHFLTNMLGEMFEFNFVMQVIRGTTYLIFAFIVILKWMRKGRVNELA